MHSIKELSAIFNNFRHLVSLLIFPGKVDILHKQHLTFVLLNSKLFFVKTMTIHINWLVTKPSYQVHTVFHSDSQYLLSAKMQPGYKLCRSVFRMTRVKTFFSRNQMLDCFTQAKRFHVIEIHLYLK